MKETNFSTETTQQLSLDSNYRRYICYKQIPLNETNRQKASTFMWNYNFSFFVTCFFFYSNTFIFSGPVNLFYF